MAEAAGLVVGAAGLAGLFSTCVDSFKLVQVYRHRHEDYDVLQTMVDNQQFLLMAWGNACGFMDEQSSPLLDDPARRERIVITLQAIQALLTNTNKLKDKYGLRPVARLQGSQDRCLLEGPNPSHFARAFQKTRSFYNTSLQRTSQVPGSLLWSISDKERFQNLVSDLRNLIEDLGRVTGDLGTAARQRRIVEYELEMVEIEADLEAIAEATNYNEDDDAVSSAARRRLQSIREGSISARDSIGPYDLASVAPDGRRSRLACDTVEGDFITTGKQCSNMEGDIGPSIGVHRVPEEAWRKVKTRQGLLPWLPILIASMDRGSRQVATETRDGDPETPKPNREKREIVTRLAINSHTLIETLNNITRAGITEDQNVMIRPFKLLSYYEPEIRETLAKMMISSPANGSEPSDSTEETIVQPLNHAGFGDLDESDTSAKDRSREELACLVAFMDLDIKDLLPSGLVGCKKFYYDQLWAVFRPGSIIVLPADDKQDPYKRAFFVTHFEGGRRFLSSAGALSAEQEDSGLGPAYQKLAQKGNAFQIHAVYLDCDGKNIVPRRYGIWRGQYQGAYTLEEKAGATPLHLLRERNEAETKLVERGRILVESVKTRLFDYNGPVLKDMESAGGRIGCGHCKQTFHDQSMSSKVMIDPITAQEHLKQAGCEMKIAMCCDRHIHPIERDPREVFEPISCEHANSFYDECTDVHDDFYLDEFMSNVAANRAGKLLMQRTLEDLHHVASPAMKRQTYMLLHYRIPGYCLTNKIWYPLDAQYLQPALEIKVRTMDDLVMPQGQKKLLVALVGGHQKKLASNKGLSILLHGPEGVGKTTAAECIAAKLGRPILPIVRSDLGSNPREFRRRLSTFVSLASRWSCVLILEDCDQYFTIGQVDGASTGVNSINAALQEELAKSKALVVFTTRDIDRIGQDLVSRVDYSLRFDLLSAQARLAVWQTCLKELRQNHSDVQLPIEDILEFVRTTSAVYQHFDNGHKIKTVCNTALALAVSQQQDTTGRSERCVLRTRHFQSVLRAKSLTSANHSWDAHRLVIQLDGRQVGMGWVVLAIIGPLLLGMVLAYFCGRLLA